MKCWPVSASVPSIGGDEVDLGLDVRGVGDQAPAGLDEPVVEQLYE
jgi:hypothetical protein